MSVTSSPDAAKLTDNVRRTRQMTSFPIFSALIQDDLSVDDGPNPVIYLLTAVM